MLTEEYAKAVAEQTKSVAKLIAKLEPHTNRITTDNPDVVQLAEITDGFAWGMMVKASIGIDRLQAVMEYVVPLSLLAYQLGYLRGEAKENIFEKMVVRDVAGEG